MTKAVKVKQLPWPAGFQVTNILGTADASKPTGYDSFIKYWREHTRIPSPVCFEASCANPGKSGGHVKLVGSATGSIFKWSWYIVPACSLHNKGSSCGTYTCKPGTLAVKVHPKHSDRFKSYPADFKKLLATLTGKHNL